MFVSSLRGKNVDLSMFTGRSGEWKRVKSCEWERIQVLMDLEGWQEGQGHRCDKSSPEGNFPLVAGSGASPRQRARKGGVGTAMRGAYLEALRTVPGTQAARAWSMLETQERHHC